MKLDRIGQLPIGSIRGKNVGYDNKKAKIGEYEKN